MSVVLSCGHLRELSLGAALGRSGQEFDVVRHHLDRAAALAVGVVPRPAAQAPMD